MIQRPVLPVPPAADRDAWRAISRRPATAAVVGRATRDGAYPALRAEDWLRYHRDGDRGQHEEKVAERHAILGRAAVAAAATSEVAHLDRVIDGLVVFCEQTSWCWPAHDDALAVSGSALPDVGRPYLDLGAGEVVAQLAWVLHLLGPELEARAPGIGERVRYEARRRVLDPFLERDDWHWLGLDGDVHNWLPWIAGNVLVAALVLEPDLERQGRVVERAVGCLDRYVASLPADGAIDEGYGYWWNGACRAIEALEIWDHVRGRDGEWATAPALRATVGFPVGMHLGAGWYVNVADGSARPTTDLAWPALFRAGLAGGNAAAVAHAVAHRCPHDVVSEERRLGRLLQELADDRWWEAPAGAPGLPIEEYWPSVQLLVARQGVDGRGLTMAAKGGHNGEHHNHNDVGSFIVALDGVPVVVDVGRPTYTAQTFGPDRYSIWTMTSAWHNVPLVRGTQQAPGPSFAAADVEASGSRLDLDLAAAYPRKDLTTWRRSVELVRDAGVVRVRDGWEFVAPDATPSALTLVLAGDVEQPAPTVLAVAPVTGGRRLGITSDRPMLVEPWPLEDPLLSSVWGERIHRVTIDLQCDIIGQSVVEFAATGEGEPR